MLFPKHTPNHAPRLQPRSRRIRSRHLRQEPQGCGAARSRAQALLLRLGIGYDLVLSTTSKLHQHRLSCGFGLLLVYIFWSILDKKMTWAVYKWYGILEVDRCMIFLLYILRLLKIKSVCSLWEKVAIEVLTITSGLLGKILNSLSKKD